MQNAKTLTSRAPTAERPSPRWLPHAPASLGRAPAPHQAAAKLAAAVEPLEIRRLLIGYPNVIKHTSLSDNFTASVSLDNSFTPAASVTTDADEYIAPTYLRAAYGLNNISFNGTPGNGQGETIAIIDAFSEPGLVDTSASNYSSSDLAVFDSEFGIPDPPSLTILNESGGTSLPSTNTNITVENALDVEYAHAMAPDASIVLIECNSLNDSDLDTGINTARNLSGVDVVSMSFGGEEYSEETDNYSTSGLGFLDDGFFQTPSGHTGITFIASSGDGGYGTQYPAASPYVLGMGGTDLEESSGTYDSESGWNDSGGGPSSYESKPSYQSGVDNTASTTRRLMPDMSLDAGTPVYVYDAGAGGWLIVTGTSIAAPSMAGVIAIADQGRALEGLGSLNGYTQTLPRIYELPANDFHDITTGSSGSGSLAQAGPGYDLVTGIGSVNGPGFVTDLAGGLTISGTVFADLNGDGVQDNGETGISGVRVYVDLNNSGSYVSSDPSAITASNGTYSIPMMDVPGGQNYTIREVLPSGYIATVGAQTITSKYDDLVTENFGDFPTTFNSSLDYYVDLNSASNTVQIFAGTNGSGTPVATIATAILETSTLTFSQSGSNPELVIDYTNGDPMAASNQFVFQPASATSALLLVEGTSANSTISVTSAGVVVNGQTIGTTKVQDVTIGAAGADSSLTANFSSNPFTAIALNAQAGSSTITLAGANSASTSVSYSFANSTQDNLVIEVTNPYTITGNAGATDPGGITLTDSSALTLLGSQTLAGLVIDANSSITIGRNGSAQSVVQSTSLIVSPTDAYLDLNNNAMIIDYGNNADPISTIDGLLQTGYANGDWNGYGIRSTAAADDSNGITAIGSADNQELGDTTFDGVTVAANSILLLYTYYGDANLDGVVNKLDVSAVSVGFVFGESGWQNGDFTYAGSVTKVDISLLSEGFTFQGAPL
jgi:SdrD B-like protein